MIKRINKFISENTEYSRRKADELIQKGKVYINNKQVKELGTKIDEDIDIIKIENKEIKIQNTKFYIALNKPKGFISTRNDEKNRKTIMDLVPKIDTLRPIGRLDKDSEGLILFSNDGEFINTILHPKFKIEKKYLLIISGKLSKENKELLENGIEIEGKKTLESKIKILKEEENSSIIEINIFEGRNRQIRKMFEKINNPVKYLKRTQIHKIQLGTLKIGEYRNLTTKEITCFQAY